jgi:sugar-specific transcriptional regulator TrmB
LSVELQAEKVLRELGLTFSQAKLYVALLKLHDEASANGISTVSSISRQDVYHLMEELQRVGLVAKVLSNPAKFKAVPMADATSLLMERRSDRTRELLQEATDLLADFPEQNSRISPRENQQFVIIPKGEGLVRRVEKAIKAAKSKIQVITPWQETIQWLFKLHEHFQEAVDRGVKVSWITENPHCNTDSNAEIIDTFTRRPGFRLRTVVPPVTVKMSLFDLREVFLATHVEKAVAESPALWTDSLMMAELARDFFEMKWKLAADYKVHES